MKRDREMVCVCVNVYVQMFDVTHPLKCGHNINTKGKDRKGRRRCLCNAWARISKELESEN